MNFINGIYKSKKFHIIRNGLQVSYKVKKAVRCKTEHSNYELIDVLYIHITNADGSESDITYFDYFEIHVLKEAIWRGRSIDKQIQFYDKRSKYCVLLNKNTTLHVAVCMYPYALDTIKELLKLPAKVNIQNWEGNTPLHLAILNPLCDVDLINVLLVGGGNPNIKNQNGDTPLNLFLLMCYLKKNVDTNTEIIKLLLRYGAQQEFKSSTYFKFSSIYLAVHASYCHWSVIEELIKYGADVNDPIVSFCKESLLHKAVQTLSSCRLHKVRLLLERKPELIHCKDIMFSTPLHQAVAYGAHSDVIKELIKTGADVKARNWYLDTPLHLSKLSRGSYSVIETLIRYGAEIYSRNQMRNTALLEYMNSEKYAANETAATALIELCAPILGEKFTSVTDQFGKTALDYALYNSWPNVLRLLLENQAKPLSVTFLNDPYFYHSSDNKRIAILFLQFFILRNISIDLLVESPELMISFNSCDLPLRNILSNFRDSCIFEVHQMESDMLTKNGSLFNYVYGNIVIGDSSPDKCVASGNEKVKGVLNRIKSNKYPHCTDLLRGCMKREKLINYLSLLIVFTNTSNVTNDQQSIILDSYSTLHLTKFLKKDTLLNLVEVFSDV